VLAESGGAAGAATLFHPEGVFEDETGRVFIADAYNNEFSSTMLLLMAAT